MPNKNKDDKNLKISTKKPHLLKTALEVRTFFEAGWFLASYPFLKVAAKGDGHPVLVLPGYLSDDITTHLLRTFLKGRNYQASGWGLGRNLGKQIDPINGCRPDLIRVIKELYAQSGGKSVSLIGWSLGGVIARELARTCPALTRQVITLGSPFNHSLRANHASWLFEKTSGLNIDDLDKNLLRKMSKPPPVPSTAIYTKSDGVTAWQCCLESESQNTQNIEVVSSHCGLGHHPVVMWIIADRLAQPESKWRHFKPNVLEKLMFIGI